MYQSEATCQPVDCFKNKLALYKCSSACWSLTMSLCYEKGICSHHDQAEKIVHFALNTINHSLYTNKMPYLQVEAIIGNSRLIT